MNFWTETQTPNTIYKRMYQSSQSPMNFPNSWEKKLEKHQEGDET